MLATNMADQAAPHYFYIPVMGTGFSIDTPLKVGRYGISSVVSVVDDHLTEEVRCYYCQKYDLPYHPINADEEDARARRTTAYLDLMHDLLQQQMDALRRQSFTPDSDLTRYFEFLPSDSSLKQPYQQMLATSDADQQKKLADQLRAAIVPGRIDVNIMTKLDRAVYFNGKPQPREHNDAMSALRGFALSKVEGSVVMSAGLNQALFTYAAEFEDFYPKDDQPPRKQIAIKVSDCHSACVQGKYLAKRGIWVSEFRVESGLNCGGHTFPTNGKLLGPILQEFRDCRSNLKDGLVELYNKGLAKSGRPIPNNPLPQRLTVQGGVGNFAENQLLREEFGVDGIGWGTPFLLVPEATNVDQEHLDKLMQAKEDDVFLSHSSPLGVPFWNLRTSASEQNRERRIAEGHPGSKCVKGYLVSDTEFTERPVCSASAFYQARKLEEIKNNDKYTDQQKAFLTQRVLAKSCICHDLAGCVSRLYHLSEESHPAVCCGPNILYFKRLFSLSEMIDHIYGRVPYLTSQHRPHFLIKELGLYVQYLKSELDAYSLQLSRHAPKYFNEFRENILEGIANYRELADRFHEQTRQTFLDELDRYATEIKNLVIPSPDSRVEMAV